MTRSSKSLTRASALADLDELLAPAMPVQPGEITAPMLVARAHAQGNSLSHVTAITLLRQAERDGKYGQPALRRTKDGRRVWAWARRTRAGRHTCGQCGS